MKIRYIDRKSGEIRIESPPAEGLLRLLYDNPFGKRTILPLVKRKIITRYYGNKMNQPSSVNKIDSFIRKTNINIEEAEKPVNEYTSFNDFFARKLRVGARKIQNGIVSPGDGRLLAFTDLDHVNNFYVKGRRFTLAEFLGGDVLAQRFKNHSLIILRLAPSDYHRYHFPYAGIPGRIKHIHGKYYSVSPIALARNFTKVFCENKREYCILKTKEQGDILVAPVGATLVGSMISTYTPFEEVEKGDEMGYFEFGGSTVVLLIDASKFKIDEDLIRNTKNRLETLVQMGEQIGVEIT
ncbi:phosphatidylserine decarboxylase [Flavobacteriaceae bacterium Ap0902]|nr:phosphatidylserine decarboxylase [Flavobacteriaceae bacterium Ap0902]